MTPEYSPPTLNDIRQRVARMSHPAAAPTIACVGSTAVTAIAAVMSPIDRSSTRRRPYLSPRLPKNAAPTGRRRYVAAKTKSVAAVPEAPPSKNTREMTEVM